MKLVYICYSWCIKCFVKCCVVVVFFAAFIRQGLVGIFSLAVICQVICFLAFCLCYGTSCVTPEIVALSAKVKNHIIIQGDSGGICNTLGNDSMCDLSKKVHMNMGPILNGYHPASTNSNCVINNIATNITCLVIRRVNHHVLLM